MDALAPSTAAPDGYLAPDLAATDILAYLDQQAQKQREQGVSGESEADKEQARRMYPH